MSELWSFIPLQKSKLKWDEKCKGQNATMKSRSRWWVWEIGEERSQDRGRWETPKPGGAVMEGVLVTRCGEAHRMIRKYHLSACSGSQTQVPAWMSCEVPDAKILFIFRSAAGGAGDGWMGLNRTGNRSHCRQHPRRPRYSTQKNQLVNGCRYRQTSWGELMNGDLTY